MGNALVQGQNYPSVITLGSGDFTILGTDGLKQPGGAVAGNAGNFAGVFAPIKASGFHFIIPTGAVIKGIVVEVSRNSSQLDLDNSRFCIDNTVTLLKGGLSVGSDYADGVNYYPTGALQEKSYGSPTDLWGLPLTADYINSSDFGVYFQTAVDDESGGTTSVDIDYIRITVYYELVTNPYAITINGLDRTKDVIFQTIKIDDVLNDQVNTCSFELVDRSGNGIPANDQEIIMVDANGTRIFGGEVLTVKTTAKGGYVYAYITCVDYSRLLDRNLVHKAYLSETDQAIIQDIVSTYCAGSGITTNNVLSGATIDQISFNYMQPSKTFAKLAQLTNMNWYIDYFKDVHYFPLTTNPAPFNITDADNRYRDLAITKDGSQLKNRVYVRGGTKLSDPTTYSVKGDGVATQFVLPDKPHNYSVTVNGVSKTVGIKNIDTSGFDWYVNFEQKYIEQDSGGTILTTSDTLAITYQYDIPILIAQEDTASIAANGVHEFPIFDTTITTTDAARDRAIAELTDYKNNMIDGTFVTITPGFISGQYMNINHTGHGVNDNYIIQKVAAKSTGGGFFEYTVTIASAKTMGIIKFLIEMLQANKDLVQLSTNEVVDELFTISDALLSDSLTDMLIDSVTTPPFAWSNDAGTTAKKMVWGLFQWS